MTCAIGQDIQPMLAVPRHYYIGFPVPTFPSCVCHQRAQHQAGPLLDPLAVLPIWPFRFLLVMVSRQIANQLGCQAINALINGFLAAIGQIALLFYATRYSFRDPADLKFLLHIVPDRFRF